MSRSNTHYYNLCTRGEIGEDGRCDWHRSFNRRSRCIPEREFMTRRGLYKRKNRFKDAGWKSWSNGPPMPLKKIWRRKVRAAYRDGMVKHPEDPILIDGHKWLGKMFNDWF